MIRNRIFLFLFSNSQRHPFHKVANSNELLVCIRIKEIPRNPPKPSSLLLIPSYNQIFSSGGNFEGSPTETLTHTMFSARKLSIGALHHPTLDTQKSDPLIQSFYPNRGSKIFSPHPHAIFCKGNDLLEAIGKLQK